MEYLDIKFYGKNGVPEVVTDGQKNMASLVEHISQSSTANFSEINISYKETNNLWRSTLFGIHVCFVTSRYATALLYTHVLS